MAPFKLRFRMGGSRCVETDTDEALIPIRTTKIRARSSTIDSTDCNSLGSLGTNECKSLLSTNSNSLFEDWNSLQDIASNSIFNGQAKELTTPPQLYDRDYELEEVGRKCKPGQTAARNKTEFSFDSTNKADEQSDCVFQLENLRVQPMTMMSSDNKAPADEYDDNETERNSLKSINDMASPEDPPFLLQESMLDENCLCNCDEYQLDAETDAEQESNFVNSCCDDPEKSADCNCKKSLNSLNLIYSGHCIEGAHYEEQLAIDSENGWGTQADFNEYQETYQQQVENCLTPEILSNKSSKEIYKDLANAMGITCKMSDGCRCMDCQSHYFDCEFDEQQNDHQKNDGGLGAGTPMFLSEVMHGSACNIL